MDDLDLMSTPINYISYQVRPMDKKQHDVQFYLEATPELALNEQTQPTIARSFTRNGLSYVEAGTIDQPICDRKGDGICIDWGYAYLASGNSTDRSLSLGDYYGMKESFINEGDLLTPQTKWITRQVTDMPAMAYAHDLGAVSKGGKGGYVMIGYDDVYAIEYTSREETA